MFANDTIEQILSPLRHAAPAILIFLFGIVLKLPFGLPALSSLSLVIVYCSVYYWALYRPDLLPIPITFLLGLSLDIFASGPFGVHCLVLVLAHGLILSQRRFLSDKTNWMIWLGEIVIAFVVVFLFWLCHVLYYVTLLDIFPSLIQFVLMVLLYPVVREFFSMIRIRFLKV